MSFVINPLYEEIIRAAQEPERDRYNSLRPYSYPTSRTSLPKRLRALLADRSPSIASVEATAVEPSEATVLKPCVGTASTAPASC
jgi:hypothetical protein